MAAGAAAAGLIIKLKKHLTQEGLDKIKELSLEMNSKRLK